MTSHYIAGTGPPGEQRRGARRAHSLYALDHDHMPVLAVSTRMQGAEVSGTGWEGTPGRVGSRGRHALDVP